MTYLLRFRWAARILMVSKNILLGVSGGIAAYKSAELVRLLRKQGNEVKVVMTRAAEKFITPLTFQALSSEKVYTDLFSEHSSSNAMDHIHLARWADIVLIAPASADIIAKITYGFADNLLTTICLATTAPICIAPAMNQQMWLNEAVQNNLNLLRNRNVTIIGPAKGEQACGEFGMGRMFEPEQLLASLNNFFKISALQNKKILITAGPTQEAIDPVRYITNRSSGKMGYALAEAAVDAGARVTLISGPTKLTPPLNVSFIDVVTANEMYEAVMTNVEDCDIFISVAAVSDYRAEKPAEQKIKKSGLELSLALSPNPDILSCVANLPHPPVTVGFAAETDNVVENAKAKLKNKKIDMIIANKVDEVSGFDQEENAVVILTQSGERVELPMQNKLVLARKIIELIGSHCVDLVTSSQEETNT